MQLSRLVPLLVAISSPPLSAATYTPGSGAATSAIQASFVNAYNRGRFSLLTLAPSGNVKAFGSPGLVQEFPAKADSTVYALVKPDPTAPTGGLDTLQIYGDLYAFYTSIGVSVAGYPTIDTTPCFSAAMGPCDYQIFSKDYALFAYQTGVITLAVRDPFFTEWANGGGINTFGPLNGAETAVTSVSGILATQQQFNAGVVFSYSVGSGSATTIGVTEPFNTYFNNVGGYMRLGLPTTEPVTVNAAGLIRQTFEYGRIELSPGGAPVVLFNISLIGIAGQSQGLDLTVGASATLTASVFDTTNQPVTGRSLSWSTSNGNVARVTGSGDTAVVQAVGPGNASIYVSGEGKTSVAFAVRVAPTCCSVGQGAPTAAIAQAFQTAIDRNGLSLMSPPPALVTRVGNGYIQAFTASGGLGTAYVVSQSDNSSTAYVLTGNLNAAYIADGGFTGPLGYPASDPLAGGAQKFASGAALGGMPVRIVPAAIASKWFLLNGPSGVAGWPTADAAAFVSINGSGGVSQIFTNGTIFGVTSGARAGQAYFSGGLILARYAALGGPAGVLGLPTADVSSNGAVQTENFEGGYIDLQPGAAAAVEHLNPRHPAIAVSQSSVVPGGRVHISATGFAPGATISFTITGQPTFSVSTASGAFVWDVVIPSGAKAGTISIQASASGSTDFVSVTYTVTSVAASLPKLTIVSGDRQTGLPGSTLTLPIVAVLRDRQGNPLQGVAVSFSASPGAAAQSSLTTDQNGQVAINFRLPPASGVAVGSLSAGEQVATFSAIAAPTTLQNFPFYTQSNGQNPDIPALAALIRYYQNLGSLPAPNGLSTPAALQQFTGSLGGLFQIGMGETVANPWLASRFAAAGLALETATADRVRDLLNAGTPSALVLNVTVDGGLYGGNMVDAIGVGSDGSVLIDDPDPVFARTSLTDYLNGFTADGHLVQGTLAAVLRVNPSSLAEGNAPFTVSSPLRAGAAAASPAGACPSIDVLSSAGTDGERFEFCDGSQPAYQIGFANAGTATLSDLTGGPAQQVNPRGGGSFSVTRTSGQLTVAAAAPAITGVTDSAAFAPGLSPGGLATVFGAGLVSGSGTTVTLNGSPVPVLGAFPFQINFQVPAGLAPGSATLQVNDALGSASQTVTVVPYAPGIFVGGGQAAIVNQDGTLNGTSNPAQRGQYVSVYCTGLGATAAQNGLLAVKTPVSVVIDGSAVAPSFAGLAPGFAGVYQVNVTVPPGLAPNSGGTLVLKEGDQTSNSVAFAVQ